MKTQFTPTAPLLGRPSGAAAAGAMLAVLLAAVSAPAADWNQWGGSPARNNVAEARNIPAEWSVGEFDAATGKWLPATSRNVAWVAELGSQSYGNPVIAGGKPLPAHG